MKSLKLALVALIGVCLLSCDAFLAPLSARNNPLDPNTALDITDQTFTPISDGYVSSMPEKNFTSTWFQIGNSSIALIKFDTAQFPQTITHAELKLFNQSASGLNNVVVSRIVVDWTESGIDWTTANDAGFTEAGGVALANFPMSSYSAWDVTGLVKEGVPFGFLVKSSDAFMVSVNSMENASNKPQLIVTGYTLP